jgi:two-component system, NtrC family, sensor kinase
VRSAIADMLRDEGHEVAEVWNGRLALNLIRQRPFDLVITDIRMPELSGRGLYEELQYFRRDLLDRFIVITGWEDADTEFFETKTAAPVIRKPFSLTAFSEAVHAVLERGSGTESRV